MNKPNFKEYQYERLDRSLIFLVTLLINAHIYIKYIYIHTYLHTSHRVKGVQIRVFSGPYFPVFELKTDIYSVNLRFQSEYRKIRTRKNSVFGYFSRSVAHDIVDHYFLKKTLLLVLDQDELTFSLWYRN